MKLRRLGTWVLPPAAVLGASFSLVTLWIDRAPRVDAPEMIDIGRHESGSRVIAHLPITNQGQETLKLLGFRPSCGACLHVVAHVPLSIAPGAVHDLQLRVNIVGTGGELVRRYLDIETNDPYRAQVRVAVQARVVGGILAVPASIETARLACGQVMFQEFQVYDTGSGHLHDINRSETTDAKHIKIERLPSEQHLVSTPNPALGKCLGKFRLHLTAPDKPDILTAEVRFFDSDRPTAPCLAVPVRISAQPGIAMIPDALVFPLRTEQGPVYLMRCICRSNDGRAFLLRVKDSPSFVTVRQLRDISEPSSTHLLEVAWRPDPQGTPTSSNILEARIRLAAILPDGKMMELELPVKCQRELK